MSHDKIKSITINENKGTVYVTAASNNCIPITYSRFKCESLEIILKEQGRDELDKVILKEFENGNFQGGKTEYKLSGVIFGGYTLENLNKLRKLKKETRGQKFIIACNNGYIGKFMKRGAKVYASKHNGKELNMVDALFKSKSFANVEIIPA